MNFITRLFNSTTMVTRLEKKDRQSNSIYLNAQKSIYFILVLFILSCNSDGIDTLDAHTPISTIENKSKDSFLFRMVSKNKSGLDFNNKVDPSDDFWDYTNYYNGSGVGIGDFNNDGLPDVYFSANTSHNKLYINKGNLKFEDQTKKFELDDFSGEWTTGVTIVDINEDGFLDIYVSCSNSQTNNDKRRNKFYLNKNGEKFIEMASDLGIDDPGYTTHASFLDYDQDGDLDLYVLNHPIDFHDRRKLNNHEKIENGTNKSDKFYRNNGNLTFTDVSLEAGINNHGFGLSVNVCDFNNDGYPDIFTTNDWGLYDQYFINQKNGTFIDMAKESFPKQSFSSMGSVISDFNNDGHPDIFVSEMESEDHATHRSYAHGVPELVFQRKLESAQYHYQCFRNALHLNNGDGTYREIARAANVDASDWSWSSILADFDNDGWKDLFVSNGYYFRPELDHRPTLSKLKSRYRRDEKGIKEKYIKANPKSIFDSVNRFYKNGQNFAFNDMTADWTEAENSLSYGAAIADFDNDGDLDIITANMNQYAFLYENTSNETTKNNYIRIYPEHKNATSDILNTKVTITSGENIQTNYIECTKGYMSSSEKVAHFGLGNSATVDEIIIDWNDGIREKYTTDKINTNLTLVKGQGEILTNHNLAIGSKLFEKLESNDLFDHEEDNFDDFRNDILKPRFHSTIGPSISVGDITGDGKEDFYISGAKNQTGAFYTIKNDKISKIGTLDIDKGVEELGTLLFDSDMDGDLDIYIASGNITLNEADPKLQDLLFINDGRGNFKLSEGALPKIRTATGMVTASDFDRDGDLDLFVGSRYKKANYPVSGSHYLLINENGKFTDATTDWKLDVSNIGMISSALWSDYNNDGWIDLIIVGEWTKIEVFENKHTYFENTSNALGLQNTEGWWNSIVGADLDKDGDIDYVIGNAGINMKYVPENDKPIKIYYGMFDKDDQPDFMLSYYYKDKEFPVHLLNDLGRKYKVFKKKFKSFNKFGSTPVQKLFNKTKMATLSIKEAHTFKSMILWNENNKFQKQELPFEAQVSNLNGILIDDFDNDTNLDILIQGNLFDWLPQFEKQDGLMGLMLKGDGKKGFVSENYLNTGFEAKNENRSLALLHSSKNDYILNGVNDQSMEVFKISNTTKKSISLTSNEYMAKIKYKNGQVENREFYFGEGYLSQSSRTLRFDPSTVEEINILSYNGETRKVF